MYLASAVSQWMKTSLSQVNKRAQKGIWPQHIYCISHCTKLIRNQHMVTQCAVKCGMSEEVLGYDDTYLIYTY